MASDDLPTITAPITALPSTITNIFGLGTPAGLTPPIQMRMPAIQRIVVILLDNFGLLEVVVHKPKFVIQASKALIMLETQNPYSHSVLHQIIHGDLERNDFNLFQFLNQNQKSTLMIGSKQDLDAFSGGTKTISSVQDTTSWVQASKFLNRVDFLWVHFLDFEKLYTNPIYRRQPPENLVQKLIHRTDKWMLGMYKQAAAGTLLIITGDHGRTHVDMYDENTKYGQWRKASLPIAVLCLK
ncbi:MAG: hypothetical protein ACTSRW_01865 [Candidatus Helarchaeota archaeon]